MKFPSIQDIELRDKKVFLRVDYNVPLVNGIILDDWRIKQTLPTILELLDKGAKIILCSHLGRPIPTDDNSHLSLQPIADHLSELLQLPVELVLNWQSSSSFANGRIHLLENIRFFKEEQQVDSAFTKALARLADVYVLDAFACCHRVGASLTGLAALMPTVAIGPLLQRELLNLEKCLKHYKQPFVGVLGGIKPETKIKLLANLVESLQYLLLSGEIAKVFLHVDKFEPNNKEHAELIESAKDILQKAAQFDCKVILPVDFIIQDPSEGLIVLACQKIEPQSLIVDIGPQTIRMYTEILHEAATILWNGPLGKFEDSSCATGTRSLLDVMAKSRAKTFVGGGQTVAAINSYSDIKHFSYVSTGGGAFLACLEGAKLPVLEELKNR